MGEMEKMEKTEKKTPRKLTDKELSILSQIPKRHRIYVNKFDGCFGGYHRSPDCDGCLSKDSCDNLTNYRRNNLNTLIGYGWQYREASP